MNNVSAELRYTKSHEWIRCEGGDKGIYSIGITKYAQDALGELVFIELPKVGFEVSAGDQCAVVESVKVASDIYAPISGKVVEVNSELSDSPNLLNELFYDDFYDDCWLFKIKASDETEFKSLLDEEKL